MRTKTESKRVNRTSPEKAKMFKPLLQLTKVILVTFVCVISIAKAYAAKEAQDTQEKTWVLSDDKINYLMSGDVCEKVNLKEKAGIRKRFWVELTDPQQKMSWPVESNGGDEPYTVKILVSVIADTSFVLSSGVEEKVINLKAYDRHRVETTLKLNKGKDVISFYLKDKPEKKSANRFRSLEVISPKFLPVHKARIKELKTPQKEAAWFQDAGYGIMFQWGYWGYPKEGPKKENWKDVYRDFNIDAFADKMKELGAGYVLWSITWRGSRFSMPLKSVEKIMGNKDYTMEYDFISKLADALNERGIKLMLYYHPGASEPEFWAKIWKGWDDRESWTKANIAIWSEIGEILGDKLGGWFVDDGQVQYYPDDFYEYIKALKKGNPNRLVSFNSYVMPPCSEYEDVVFGEYGSNRDEKVNGVVVSGRNVGLFPHRMFAFEGHKWGIWKKNRTITPPSPKYKNLQKELDGAIADKCPISINLLMYEDGTISEESEAIIKALKR